MQETQMVIPSSPLQACKGEAEPQAAGVEVAARLLRQGQSLWAPGRCFSSGAQDLAPYKHLVVNSDAPS